MRLKIPSSGSLGGRHDRKFKNISTYKNPRTWYLTTLVQVEHILIILGFNTTHRNNKDIFNETGTNQRRKHRGILENSLIE